MTLKKELPYILILLLPILYLSNIWNALPQKIPMHWNMKGQIDRYGNKSELLILSILVPVITYILLLVAPKIDKKWSLKKMGKKYFRLKFLILLLTSILTLIIIYSVKNQSLITPNSIYLISGVIILVLGNYMQTVKKNYLIGIRNKWTLNSDFVWGKTHKIGGKLFFITGFIIILSSLMFKPLTNMIVMMSLIIALCIYLSIYSHKMYKIEEKKE